MSQHEHDQTDPAHDQDAGGHDHGHEHSGGLRGWLLDLVRPLRPHSHDAADSVDSALESSSEGIRAVKISLVALLVTALAQATIVVITGSVALLADTIHNFSDVLTAVPLWIGFVLGRRLPNTRFTYGYGSFCDLEQMRVGWSQRRPKSLARKPVPGSLGWPGQRCALGTPAMTWSTC